jgi:DNA-directed RNA polymerase subunit omega
MARITVEDCLQQVNNRFALIKMATKRTKQLLEGAQPLAKADNKEIIIALREIAAGRVKMSAPSAKKSAKKTAKYAPVKIEEERLYS